MSEDRGAPPAYIEVIRVAPLERFPLGWDDRVVRIENAGRDGLAYVTILRRVQ